jgi:hypothetical protein
MTRVDYQMLPAQEEVQDSMLRGWNNPGSQVDPTVFLRPTRLFLP